MSSVEQDVAIEMYTFTNMPLSFVCICSYRGMAASVGTMFGKVGALMGNILIGIFIDVYCVIPIIVSCTFLISEYTNKIFNTILLTYVEYNLCASFQI